jgi:zinc and cadmium transporter
MMSFFDSPTALLGLYCLVVFAASLAGGWLPTLLRLTHTRLQMAVSFVGGLMLGLALLGMLPHALHQVGSVTPAVAWLLAGFLVMFFLQRFLPFHHHDVVEGNPLEPCGHTHSLAERSARSLSWAGVALGLSLHSVFDGLAIAAAVAAGGQTRSGALGLGTALAVILHKPFGALAISTLMVASHASRSSQRLMNLAFALVTPLGALLFFLGAGHLAHSHPSWVGAALAFCAGTFLCIACADLLPELQFHSHDRIKLSFALLAGIGVAVLIARFGHAHQEHGHDQQTPAAHAVFQSGAEAAAIQTLRAAAAGLIMAKQLDCGEFTAFLLHPSVAAAVSPYASLAHPTRLRPQSSRLWTC